MLKPVADLSELIRETQNDAQNTAFVCSLGWVNKGLAEKVRAIANLDLGGYEHIADSYFLKHVWAHHSDQIREAKRGQTAISLADLELLPLIFEQPEQLSYLFEKGKHRFVFEKTVGKTRFTYIAEARIGKFKKCCAITLYARPVKGA